MLPAVFTLPSTEASAKRMGTASVTPGCARRRVATSVEKAAKPSAFTT